MMGAFALVGCERWWCLARKLTSRRDDMSGRHGDFLHAIAGPNGMVLIGALAGLSICVIVLTATAAQSDRLKVLTTVAPLTNIVKNIGGPHIDLHGLIPGGTDSHTFEPAPS